MDPALPPKLVQPVQVNVFSFEQVLSDKLHSTLMIKPVASKKVSHDTDSWTLINPREPICHFTLDEMPDPKLQVVSLLCDHEMRTDALATNNNSIIVQDMKEKKTHSFSPSRKIWSWTTRSIITKKKRKTADEILLTFTHMRPSLDKLYQVSNLYLHNVIITVIKEHRVSFSAGDLSNI
jgi:hypothetical protein